MEGIDLSVAGDAVSQMRALRQGQWSPRELVAATIAQIETRNPRLNAVIHPMFDDALARASRENLAETTVAGVPILVKDMLCEIAGAPYHMGMALLRDLEWVGRTDSHLAGKLAAAGFIVLGRTNTPELAIALDTDGAAYGPTINPWAPGLSCGGSSGGSAAAVASGMVAIAHGNDISGSIRVPASACGVIGLKPSRGRISLGPQFGQHWAMLTQEGCLARTVRDVALFLDMTSGQMPGDPFTAPPPTGSWLSDLNTTPPRLRIGVQQTRPGGRPVHPDCAEAVKRTAEILEGLGHEVTEADVTSDDDVAELDSAFYLIIAVWVAREIARISQVVGRKAHPSLVEPRTWRIAETGMGTSAARYVAAVERLESAARQLSRHWASDIDILLTPTMPELPLSRQRLSRDLSLVDRAGTSCFTVLANVTGQPAISLPVHWNPQGVPVGVQLVAEAGREDLLLRVARQIELAGLWADRYPMPWQVDERQGPA